MLRNTRLILALLALVPVLFSFYFALADEEPLVLERPRLTIEFTPPGEILDLEINTYFFDTSVVFIGDDFTLTLHESNTVFSKRANINYESRVLKAVCGEPTSLRQSDFTEMMTGATGTTSSNPVKVGDYNACLQLEEMNVPGEESSFSFTLMYPFYSFSGKGSIEMKEALLETLRSFTVYGFDGELTKPSDKEIPQKTIDMVKKLIQEPLDQIIDTDVVMTRDDEVNPENIMNPTCAPTTLPGSDPIFSMGLTCPRQLTIRRDGFIPLWAEAEHYKKMNLVCKGFSPCGDGETWFGGYYAPVRLEWEILSGDATFVDVGCLPNDRKKATGESVVLKPGMILKGRANEQVNIRLSAFDENNQKIETKTVELSLVSQLLSSGKEIKIDVNISGPSFQAIPYLKPSIDEAACTMSREFQEINTLNKPTILLPKVTDASSLVFGQRILLRADSGTDTDQLVFNCKSSCEQVEDKKISIQEDIIYEWRLEGIGVFENTGTKEAKGSSVIYRAPDKNSIVGTVKIYCTAKNRKSDWTDQASGESQVTLNVYRPVVIFDQPLAKSWLPEYDTEVDMSTRMVYYTSYSDEEFPKPALAHMSTVYNLTLDQFSNYEGICTNFDNSGQEAEGAKYDIYFDALKHKNDWNSSDRDDLAVERRSYLRMKNRMVGPAKKSASLEVRDYGAYAHLLLDYLDEQYWDWNHVVYKIPVDETGNRMGDHAPQNKLANSIGDLSRDRDDQGVAPHGKPSMANRGDGYTIFEEYRGFMVCDNNQDCSSTVHRRTNPNQRDLFLLSDWRFTFNVFSNATGVQVHRLVDDSQMDVDSRVVNRFEKNMMVHDGEQHGLIIKSGLALFDNEENLGRVYWTDDSKEFQNLKFAKYIEINVPMCNRGGYSREEVVAHEIAHACGVPHHGGDGNFNLVCIKHPQQNSCMGSSFQADFAQNGTKFSGNLRCFMRYEQNFFTRTPGSNVRRCNNQCDGLAAPNVVVQNARLVLDLPQGTVIPGTGMRQRNQLCNDQGANSLAGQTANSAGNCFSRLRVKSWGD